MHPTIFLSTPSARRATLVVDDGHLEALISIHALREEGDAHKRHGGRYSSISIHALREEGDSFFWLLPLSARQFLSTPSARRATEQGAGNPHGKVISIHALREEGDRRSLRTAAEQLEFLSTPSARRATAGDVGNGNAGWNNFYPRPPRGGRPDDGADRVVQIEFLSTPSARRATLYLV